MVILIGESGGTKTDWALIQDERTLEVLQTGGLNPSLSDWESIRQILLGEVKPNLAGRMPEQVYFFGAGMGRKHAVEQMERLIREALGPLKVLQVQTDLLGAGYASLGDHFGIVGILGTGSVAFRYESGHVINRQGGWGYLLADEGGGSYLGRTLLRGLLGGRFSPEINGAYKQFMGCNLSEALTRLYNAPQPSLFLARQTPFLVKHRDDPEIRVLILSGIAHFLDHYLLPLTGGDTEDEIVFTGGVARIFKELVLEACRSRSLDNARVLEEATIYAIVKYFKEKRIGMP